jgi:hypothetical protein
MMSVWCVFEEGFDSSEGSLRWLRWTTTDRYEVKRVFDVWKHNDGVMNRGRATDGKTVEMIVNVMSWE